MIPLNFFYIMACKSSIAVPIGNLIQEIIGFPLKGLSCTEIIIWLWIYGFTLSHHHHHHHKVFINFDFNVDIYLLPGASNCETKEKDEK